MNAEPLTITDAAPLIRRGDLTPSDLLEQCLARVDRYEPTIRAWAHLDRERARQDAARLTDEAKAGRYRGPLHGIPVGIKDIIDVFDMPTGCGSKLWANSYARRDATCVERLRQAGAVIVGKTVTTPFAYIDPPPTRNPWNLDRTPGGSSSGSAAAVACGMVLAALGTQTGGSVTRPASYCGVCSLKPTHGRVSVNGMLPFAPSLDHVGVMANCVRDLATVFDAIVGPRPHREGGDPVENCTDAVDRKASSVVPSNTFWTCLEPFAPHLTDEAGRMLRGTIDYLKFMGDPLREASLRYPLSELRRWHRVVMATDAAGYHGGRLERHSDDYPARISDLIAEGLEYSGVEYAEARAMQAEVSEMISDQLGRPNVFVTPAASGTAPDPSTTGDPVMNVAWSLTGHPTVSLPIGWSTDGLPFSVQLVGKWTSEAGLLASAAFVEQLLEVPRRVPPVP